MLRSLILRRFVSSVRSELKPGTTGKITRVVGIVKTFDAERKAGSIDSINLNNVALLAVCSESVTCINNNL